MYTVTIVREVPVRKVQRGEYTKVGQVKADCDNNGMTYVNGVKDKYEYGPDREYTTMEDQEIYKQQVENLDLSTVIMAVNALRKD